jgi:hypothetical protein
MAAEIKDVDHGYKALVERVFGFQKPVIDVGILEDGPHGDDDVTVLQVGIFNEFGTANAPARSFIRAWFDENEGQLRADIAVLMESVIAGKRTKEQILELIGQRAVAQIQARMATNIPPPNRPSTIKRKGKGGSTTTLIDTGILRSSITYKVKENE